MKSSFVSFLFIILALTCQNDGLSTKEVNIQSMRGLIEDIDLAKENLMDIFTSTANLLIEELELISYLNYNDTQEFGLFFQNLLNFQVDVMEVSSLRRELNSGIHSMSYHIVDQLGLARMVRAASSDVYYYLDTELLPDRLTLTELSSCLEMADSNALDSLRLFENDLSSWQQEIKYSVDMITTNLTAEQKETIDSALTSIKTDMDIYVRSMMFSLIEMNDSTNDAIAAIQIVLEDLPLQVQG